MIPVEAALAKILTALTPLGAEEVSVEAALGRVLAEDVAARVTQPPKPVSAMDGYAVKAADVAIVPATLTVIGEAPAGRGFQGMVESGQAVRIFTGAPLPDGADSIVIQEDTEASGARVTVKEAPAPGMTPQMRAAMGAAAEAAEKAEQEKAAAQNPPPQKNTAIGDMPCLPLEDLLTVLVSERRLGYLADAIDHTGTVHMWFMSRERREWASLTVADDLTACITAQGASWNFALEPMKPAVGE